MAVPDWMAPGAPRYWKREPMACGTGLLSALPDSVRVPCFIAETNPLDTETWPLEQYGKAAYHIGLMQGTYLAGAPLPASDWLSRDPLTHWTADADVALKKLVDYRGHPIVQRIYPAEVIDTTRQLCKERPLFLEGRHRLPQTLCHQNVFRRNLFAQDDYTLAIDWEMMGIGAAWEDLAGLVSADLALREVDPAQGDALDKVVFSGYMDGLRDIGWQGDADLIWFGYTAATALWYGLCLIEPFVSIATDEGAQAFWTEEPGCTLDELFEGQVMTRALWGRLTEEARRLIDRVGDRG